MYRIVGLEKLCLIHYPSSRIKTVGNVLYLWRHRDNFKKGFPPKWCDKNLWITSNRYACEWVILIKLSNFFNCHHNEPSENAFWVPPTRKFSHCELAGCMHCAWGLIEIINGAIILCTMLNVSDNFQTWNCTLLTYFPASHQLQAS